MSSRKPIPSRWITFFKVAISVASLVYVAVRLAHASGTADGQSFSPAEVLQHAFREASYLLLFAFLLIPLNLGLEALKWNLLIRDLYPGFPFLHSFRAVLAGMSIGIFTPNRIGEYAGRVIFLPEGRRIEATLQTFPDRLSQMVVTLLVGFSFLITTSFHTTPAEGTFSVLIGNLPALLPFLLLVLLAVFFSVREWMPWLASRMTRWFQGQTVSYPRESLTAGRLWLVLFLSALRYAVFTFQYLLLMYAFGFQGEVIPGLGMIALIFLLKSVIPFVGMAELGVREAAAVTVMGAMGYDEMMALQSTVVLYVFNIILPSLTGLVFILRYRAVQKRREA